MKNPWLQIPASDYKGHMGLPGVNQLSFLGSVFKEAIEKYDSTSIAYLGCAVGNGLEYVNANETKSVTAIDMNREYLEILRDRYHERLPMLRTVEADLNDLERLEESYSLIYAGLLFEYLPPEPLIDKIQNWLKDDGMLVVVLQLQDSKVAKISPTPYTSLKSLDLIMNLISGEKFRLLAKEGGMEERNGRTTVLESGKSFYIGTYQKRT